MNGKTIFRALTFALGTAGLFGVAAQAAPPWGGLIALKRVDADPNKEYALTESQGPWMVMACSFSGEGSEKQAHDLVLELRDRYKLEAFMHKAEIKLGAAPIRGLDEFGRPRKMKYNRNKGADTVEEYAVLLGDFQTADEPAGQQLLQKIKFAQPKCLEVEDGEQTHQSLAGWRMLQRHVQEAVGLQNSKYGPMAHAFITTNPILPSDYFNAKGLDEFVINLNRDENMKWSLLECPGKYTLQVAQFKGAVVIDQKEIEKISGGKTLRSKLSEAGDKAERLTDALRIKGYEAYTFHDRYSSCVCVGSFDSVGSQQPDGTILPNPQIVAMMNKFTAVAEKGPGASGTVVPKKLAGIPFDLQPVPVKVPRPSVGANYSRTMLGLR